MSIDPTAFKIDFDPRSRRMTGITAHGNVAFDVPFISEITDTLWQGGCTNGLVLPMEVKHLISLYPWEHYDVTEGSALQSFLNIKMYDSNNLEDDALLWGLGEWVNRCSRTGITLVHCQAGLNRSSLVAALALMIGGMLPSEAIALLREKRSPAVLCNKTFESYLLSFEQSNIH